MNPEEIIAMAKEAGFGLHMDLLDDPHLQANAQRFLQKLERFAALVAAKEREACAQVCLELHSLDTPWGCAVAIRARGTKEGV